MGHINEFSFTPAELELAGESLMADGGCRRGMMCFFLAGSRGGLTDPL